MKTTTAYNGLTKEFKDFCETKFMVTENVVDINGNPIVIATYTDSKNNEINCYKTIKKETSMSDGNFKYLIDYDKKKPGLFFGKLLEIYNCSVYIRISDNDTKKITEYCNILNDLVIEWLKSTGIPITKANIRKFTQISIFSEKLRFDDEQASLMIDNFFKNMLYATYYYNNGIFPNRINNEVSSRSSEQLPSFSIQIKDVFRLYTPPCGHPEHHYWKVVAKNKEKTVLQCKICNRKTSVCNQKISQIGKYAYHGGKYNFLIPILPCDILKKRITKADVIVLSSSKHCSDLNHKIDDCIGILPIKTDKEITYTEVDIGYCRNCNKYIMLTSTYLNIKGEPVCWVKDLRTNQIYNDPDKNFTINVSEHIIHKYGYNVQSNNELLDTERQQILINLINNKVLSKNEIISHLEYCIRMSSGRSNMSNAIRKWKQDIEYLRTYSANEDIISVNSLTLKHKK